MNADYPYGLVRPESLLALGGVDRIIHAGDVGAPAVLGALAAIAPVTAVRANNDHGPWAQQLAATAAVEIGDAWPDVLHDVNGLDLDPGTAGFAAVIAGHSDQPKVSERGSVLCINPGSAGPRRFRLPVSLARRRIAGGSVEAEVVLLSASNHR